MRSAGKEEEEEGRVSYIFFLLSVQKYSNFENIIVYIHSQDIFKYILTKTIYKYTGQNITTSYLIGWKNILH